MAGRIASLAPLGIPRLGFGVGTTFFKRGGDTAAFDEKTVASIRDALEAGFRHIDGAQVYGTEAEIGEALRGAIKDGVVKREDVWVTTKLADGNKEPEKVEPTLRKSLEDLKVDQVDLFLIHSPFKSDTPVTETWKAVEGIADKGLAKWIGVSNFGVAELEAIRAIARIPPAVNQIEQHPHLIQQDLVDYCRANNILLQSYTPLGPVTRKVSGGEELVNYLNSLAEEKKTSPAMLLLKWNLDRGNCVITTSRHPERVREYLEVESVSLSVDEIQKIDELGAKARARFYWVDQFPDEKNAESSKL